jgi:hypothetical protein
LVCLLVEFVEFNETYYKYSSDLFTAFVDKIFTVTVNDDATDSTGLRWSKKSIQTTNKTISYITQYSDWLCANKEIGNQENLKLWLE